MIKQKQEMMGVVGYAVMPRVQPAPDGSPVFIVMFVDRDTETEFHVHMTEAACDDLAAQLQGRKVMIAPAGALDVLKNGHQQR